MTRLIILLLIVLAGCADDTSPANSKEPAETASGSGIDNEVEEEQKSIEEAADAAAKLVEEEAREEIEQAKTDK
jgi:cellobiose-specific phosphotransferase system component IIA